VLLLRPSILWRVCQHILYCNRSASGVCAKLILSYCRMACLQSSANREDPEGITCLQSSANREEWLVPAVVSPSEFPVQSPEDLTVYPSMMQVQLARRMRCSDKARGVSKIAFSMAALVVCIVVWCGQETSVGDRASPVRKLVAGPGAVAHPVWALGDRQSDSEHLLRGDVRTLKQRNGRTKASMECEQINTKEICDEMERKHNLIMERRLEYSLLFGAMIGCVFFAGVLVEASKSGSSYEQMTDLEGRPGPPCFRVLLAYSVVRFLTNILVPLASVLLAACNCTSGMLWEFHLVAAVVFMIGKALEVGIYFRMPTGGLGLCVYALRVGGSLLVMIDEYTDCCFIAVAFACGSTLYWVAGLIVYVIGVVLAQYGAAWYFSLDDDIERWGVAKVAGFDLITELAPSNYEGAKRYERGENTRDDNFGPYLGYIFAMVRLCHDGLQVMIQLFWMLDTSLHPQIITSILIALMSGFWGLALSYCRPALSYRSQSD